MKRFGYKVGIVVGLLLFALGCFLFIPAANTMSYAFFLGALFVLSCGLTILETAANPYITVLGDPAKATQRLNFAQSFNGLAAFVAPIVGGYVILADEPKSAGEIADMTEQARLAYIQAETALVKGPYLVLGLIILLVAMLFIVTKLPEIQEEEDAVASKGFFGAFRHKNVSWAVVAQFFLCRCAGLCVKFLIGFC